MLQQAKFTQMETYDFLYFKFAIDLQNRVTEGCPDRC
jgi:hypothetical protein